MAATTVHVHKEIHADPQAVWRVITDLDHAADVLSGVVSVERVEGDGYDVGVRWRETRRMFGKEATEEMWVSAVDEPRSTTVSSESAGTVYTTVFRCEPSDLGTVLTVEFTGVAGNAGLGHKLAWALFGRLGLKATRKVLEQDLADIANAAEGPAR